jgi:Transposase DDE domain
MDDLAGRGITVLVTPDADKRKAAGPGWGGGRYAFMRRVFGTDRGRELYRKRQVTIEPVFAHTKFNRRIDRFLRRGISGCRSEWRLITATHNVLKLHSHRPPPRPPDRARRRRRRPTTSTDPTQADGPLRVFEQQRPLAARHRL